jgi:two-component system LytT family response regulator
MQLSGSQTIRAVVVDDVALAREAIRVWLSEESDIMVVGEASNGLDAVEVIRKLLPDLLFLDVKLPGLDGFGVLKKVGSACAPAVIFMTAYDRYAVRAFEAHALDYLLKPIGRRRFNAALDRVRQQLLQQQDPREVWQQMLAALDAVVKGATERATPTIAAAAQSVQGLPVKDRELTLLLRAHEIDWIEAAQNYAIVHSGTRRFMIRMTIGELEARLAPVGFARVSKSAIVNKDRIHGFKSLWHGDYEIHLRDGTVVRLSRRYRNGVLP